MWSNMPSPHIDTASRLQEWGRLVRLGGLTNQNEQGMAGNPRRNFIPQPWCTQPNLAHPSRSFECPM